MGQVLHCQCCGREIKAKLGSIAHHGYQRPGYGWQTQSCMGARYEPYEVSRTRLGEMLAAMRDLEARLQTYYDAVHNETKAATFEYTVYKMGKWESFSLNVTRETFEEIRKTNAQQFIRRSCYTFDRVKELDLGSQESRLKFLRSDIKIAQRRYNEWKQLLIWNNNEWENVK